MAGEVTEICLFWGDWQIQRWWACMPRSDWSSWVQAIGVIFALGISIWVATWPRRQAVKSSVAQAKAFSIILYKYLRYIRLICPGNHEDALRLYASIISDLMETNSNLNYGYLSNRMIVHLYELRCASITVNQYLQAFEATGEKDVLNNLYNTLNGIASVLDISMEIIIKESNLVLENKENFDALLKEIDRSMAIAVQKGREISEKSKSS